MAMKEKPIKKFSLNTDFDQSDSKLDTEVYQSTN